MTNPLRGTYVNNRWYNYVSDSYRESVGIKSSASTTQDDRTFSYLGTDFENFTITLALDSTYTVRDGDTDVGTTTWVGVSRLEDLKGYINTVGASMPITFVTPYGATYSTVPTGSLDIEIFNPQNPASCDSTNGTEFRVTLSLAASE